MPNTLRSRLAALADTWANSDRQVDNPDDPCDVTYAAGVDWGKRIAAHDLRKLLDLTQGLAEEEPAETERGPGRQTGASPNSTFNPK